MKSWKTVVQQTLEYLSPRLNKYTHTNTHTFALIVWKWIWTSWHFSMHLLKIKSFSYITIPLSLLGKVLFPKIQCTIRIPQSSQKCFIAIFFKLGTNYHLNIASVCLFNISKSKVTLPPFSPYTLTFWHLAECVDLSDYFPVVSFSVFL